jgi:hypothetical protein
MAQPSLWTCSNDNTVLYVVLDMQNNMAYAMFDDKGVVLAMAHFTKKKTKEGYDFLYSALTNGVSVGLITAGKDKLVMGLTREKEGVVKFDCN